MNATRYDRVVLSLLVLSLVSSPICAAEDKPTVLITGSNRGIGSEFVRQFYARDWRIIATARSPDDAADLRALTADDPDIIIEQLDVTDHARVA